MKWTHLGRLATVEFWDLALARALRSFLQGISVAFAGGVCNILTLDWQTLLLSGAAMAIASLITSMAAKLPEEESND